MTRCQVSGRARTATARCDNGFALCGEHRHHNHGTIRRGLSVLRIAPKLRAIRGDGEYLRPR